MASNSPASEFLFDPESPERTTWVGAFDEFDENDDAFPAASGDWNPTATSMTAVRGRHRVAKQRGGGMARSGAVLGVGVIAAVGAGGMASAQNKPPVSISMPDLAQVTDELPDAKSLPGIGSLISGDDAHGSADAAGPLSQAGLTDAGSAQGGAAEALRARIMRQVEQQEHIAAQEKRDAAEKAAARAAAAKAAAAKEKAAAAAKKAKEEAARKAEAERQARLARQYTLPVGSYTLTSGFGAAGTLWANNHTGQDFAAPTGTPVKAIHSGTITEAGWAGSYGYRIVLTLSDGTELWFCHLSSMTKTSGPVSTGETIARVGATGNVTGPHLHLEVRPGGGGPIDPMPWLRQHGLTP